MGGRESSLTELVDQLCSGATLLPSSIQSVSWKIYFRLEFQRYSDYVVVAPPPLQV